MISGNYTPKSLQRAVTLVPQGEPLVSHPFHLCSQHVSISPGVEGSILFPQLLLQCS